MLGDYRLLRQGGGRTAFAHVYVRVVSRKVTDPQVVVMINPEGHTSVIPSQEPELFTAAIQGCVEVLQSLETEGVEISEYQVIIVRLGISLVDTLPDAVRTAAFLATAVALGIGDSYRPAFEGEWKVVRQQI